MQYQVPQFIEVEDKLFAELTFKQFLYVGAGGAIGFIFWALIPSKFIAIILGAPFVGFFLAAAFFKVNGRPFLFFVEGAMKYFVSAKKYIWRKTEKKIEKIKPVERASAQVALPKLSQSKLRDLSWGLDVQDRFDNK